MNELERRRTQAKGIHLPPGMQWTPARRKANSDTYQIINPYLERTGYAYDAAPLTAPNVGGPAQFFNTISPNITRIIFSKMSATKLLELRKEGAFKDDTVSLRVIEMTGSTSPYDDFNEAATSDVNSTFPIRESYRYSTKIIYGDLEMERAGATMINLIAEKQEAASHNLARTENQLYLFGMANKNLHGLLNDPNLNAPIQALSVTNSQGSGKVTWSDKAKDATSCVNHIVNDIRAMFEEIAVNNGGHISPDTPMTLVLSEKRMHRITEVNMYGMSVEKSLKEAFPNIRFEQLHELSMAEGERAMLIVDEVLGQKPGWLAFSEKARVTPVLHHNTWHEQTFSGACYGAIITQPSLIAQLTGI